MVIRTTIDDLSSRPNFWEVQIAGYNLFQGGAICPFMAGLQMWILQPRK